MTLSFALFTYINVWWITLFFVLPFGVRRDAAQSPLDYAVAPKAHKWKKLLIINSLISLGLTALIAGMIHAGVVSLKGGA